MKAARIRLLSSAAAAFLLSVSVLAAFAAPPADAQTYEELPPELEERAQRIYSGLMCPQCAGQTIDESNAPIAEAMRDAVKAQLRNGMTDSEIMDSLVQSYGESVLASPPTRGFSLLAWLVPPLALLLGAAAVAVAVRAMRAAPAPAAADGGRGAYTGESADLPFDLVDRELGEDAPEAEER